MRKLLTVMAAALLASSLTLQHSVAAEQHATLQEMFEDGSDFYPENGTLVIESERPAVFKLGSPTYANDPQDVVDYQLKRSLIYGALRPFIHTNIDAVKVTAFPVLTTYNPHTAKALDKPTYTITITRDAAFKTVQKFLDVKDFGELVTKYGSWSDEFNNLYYEDKHPGLNVFFNELIKNTR